MVYRFAGVTHEPLLDVANHWIPINAGAEIGDSTFHHVNKAISPEPKQEVSNGHTSEH
jgi:hypothetical protein